MPAHGQEEDGSEVGADHHEEGTRHDRQESGAEGVDDEDGVNDKDGDDKDGGEVEQVDVYDFIGDADG